MRHHNKINDVRVWFLGDQHRFPGILQQAQRAPSSFLALALHASLRRRQELHSLSFTGLPPLTLPKFPGVALRSHR